LRLRGCTVATGVFGARMQVSSVNEGPMTLLLET
jgi:D-tyrosyl-tRNA(Tyr) deacylase